MPFTRRNSKSYMAKLCLPLRLPISTLTRRLIRIIINKTMEIGIRITTTTNNRIGTKMPTMQIGNNKTRIMITATIRIKTIKINKILLKMVSTIKIMTKTMNTRATMMNKEIGSIMIRIIIRSIIMMQMPIMVLNRIGMALMLIKMKFRFKLWKKQRQLKLTK
jgi:hypothetical protein